MKVQTLRAISTFPQDSQVYTAGWIRTMRTSKNVAFIELHDGSQMKTTQCVIEASHPDYGLLSELTLGSCIRIQGTLKTGLSGKQTHEILISSLTIEGIADASFPLQKKRHGYDYLRTIPHLRMRTNTFYAVFKVRSVLTEAIQRYLSDNDFVYIQAPAITTTDAEGGGEVFRISTLDATQTHNDYTDDFFGKPTYLSVTGQLNLEPFITGFRNVYTFGPSFRAEKSNTTRHVAEFWQVEPEMAFVGFEELMEIIESMTKYMIQYTLDHAYEELEFFDKWIESGLIEKLKATATSDYVRISYNDAMELIAKHSSLDTSYGLQTEHERYLVDEHFKKPVFVTDYPKDEKAFYMKQNDDGQTVAATDLLFPKLGEVVGASEREIHYDKLQQRITELGLSQETYQWYLDTRKFGTCQHSGFGIGVERFMRFITGMENIRDVIAYPRTPGHAEF